MIGSAMQPKDLLPRARLTENTVLRSSCPMSYTLEMVRDSWSLLIVRDIVYFGKKTFGEFRTSQEGIARNILSNRLARLVEQGILTRRPHPDDGRKDLYELTETGLDLIPILLAMAKWGATHFAESDAPPEWIQLVRSRRNKMTTLICDTVRSGGATFAGENSAVSKL